jgi:hypothetical protein
VISRADAADFLVRQIDDRALIGTTPLLIRLKQEKRAPLVPTT